MPADSNSLVVSLFGKGLFSFPYGYEWNKKTVLKGQKKENHMKDAKSLFTERRSINFFDPERILPEGVLKEIVDLAVTAPSAFNLQPWRIIAVQSAEARQKLFDAAPQPKIKEAPVTLILLADKEGYADDNPEWEAKVAMFGNREQVDGYRHFTAMIYGSTEARKLKFAESNTGLLAMSLMYAAQVYGIESHPMSGMDFDAIKAAFHVEDRYEVSMLISFGYLAPGKVLYPRAARKGFDVIVDVQ